MTLGEVATVMGIVGTAAASFKWLIDLQGRINETRADLLAVQKAATAAMAAHEATCAMRMRLLDERNTAILTALHDIQAHLPH